MKKVVLICGSPRPEGNTAQVVEECRKVIETKGVNAEAVNLGELRIESCRTCYTCKEKGRCAIDDGLNDIIEKIRPAKGLVVASPVYFGTARGDVMAALQRIVLVSMMTGGFLSGKVGGPIAVARRGSHTSTLQKMLMFYLINEMVVVGSNYWNMVFGLQPGDVWKDEEGMATVRRFAENVADLVVRLE